MSSPLYLYVNGNRIHDESGDGSHKPVTFKSAKEGEAFADALYDRTVARAEERGHRFYPPRSSYVVASEPPPVPDPAPEPTESPDDGVEVAPVG